jgi:hypothetical protein
MSNKKKNSSDEKLRTLFESSLQAAIDKRVYNRKTPYTEHGIELLIDALSSEIEKSTGERPQGLPLVAPVPSGWPWESGISLGNVNVPVYVLDLEFATELVSSTYPDILREEASISSKYLLDYREFVLLASPDRAREEDLDQIGSVAYIFGELASDTCCLTPASAWEFVKYIDSTLEATEYYDDFSKLKTSYRISPFLQALESPDSDPDRQYKKLKETYDQMGGLARIVSLSDYKFLQSDVIDLVTELESLVRSRKILSLDEMIKTLPDSVRASLPTRIINSESYKPVYDRLTVHRPLDSQVEANKVDAYNVSLSLQLTKAATTFGSNALNIAHSYYTTEAFDQITYVDKIGALRLYRKPLNLATSLLLHRRYPSPIERKDFVVDFLENARYVIKHPDALDYDTRLALIHRRDPSELVEKDLPNLLQAYEANEKLSMGACHEVLEEIRELRRGKIKNLEKLKRERREKVVEILSDQDSYVANIRHTQDVLRENLRRSIDVLDRFIFKEHLQVLDKNLLDRLESFRRRAERS